MEFKNKHSLGQNFLEDDNILNNIIDSVSVMDNDVLLEIGPGLGFLTKKLKCFGLELYSFEIDDRTKPYLDKLVDDKTFIIYQDFLKVKISDYISPEKRVHVIANIPYYITTPIIEHVLDSECNIIDLTLMVQNEVADRLSSMPGKKDYGYITAYLNYYFDIKKLFVVNKEYFNPIPKVDSALIQLKRIKRDNQVKNIKLLKDLLRDSFQFKRKNLKNNLKNYDFNAINDILCKHGLNINCRAEDVSIDIFIEIVNKITD